MRWKRQNAKLPRLQPTVKTKIMRLLYKVKLHKTFEAVDVAADVEEVQAEDEANTPHSIVLTLTSSQGNRQRHLRRRRNVSAVDLRATEGMSAVVLEISSAIHVVG
jgi:hypothetical protein